MKLRGLHPIPLNKETENETELLSGAGMSLLFLCF
jgi:hypothetical protein